MIRIALFRDSGYKMLLQGGEVANVEKKGPNAGALGRPGGYSGPGQFQAFDGFIPQNLEGRAMLALNRFGESAKMALDPMRMKQFEGTSVTAGNTNAVFVHLWLILFIPLE